jgi:hypothetical protein
MTRFTQAFTLGAIAVGLIAIAVGVILGEVSLGFAFVALFAFGVAQYVLWDHIEP